MRRQLRFKLWISLATALLLPLLAACDKRASANPLVGEWAGVLRVDGKTHEAAMHIRPNHEGGLIVSLDAVDEHVMGLQAANVALDGNNVSFDVPVVNGKYKGTIAIDGETISGVWTKPPQAPSSLQFTRQSDQATEKGEEEF